MVSRLSAVEQIVPRGTIFAERRRLGEVCWKWLVFFGLHLPEIKAFCALVQRMGIFVSVLVWNNFRIARKMRSVYGEERGEDCLYDDQHRDNPERFSDEASQLSQLNRTKIAGPTGKADRANK